MMRRRWGQETELVPRKKKYDYDVALSFAGEDRAIAEQLAQLLRDSGARVF
jgi:hypothetical protein